MKSPDELARGGKEVAALVPVPDAPLEVVHDVRLDIAFAALRSADPAQRLKLAALLEEFGAISPDPYEAAIEVAETLGRLFTTAERDLQPGPASTESET